MPIQRAPTVLVVEDEVLIRLHAADSLRDHGFIVVEAADGHQAVEALKADASIDVVFTDITLPGQPDGFGLAQWIRSHNSSMPIILTSGGHNAAKAAEQCKGEPFFEKPYDIGELASRIRLMLAGEGAN